MKDSILCCTAMVSPPAWAVFNILNIFPPAKWLVSEAGAAALKTLVLNSCLFHSLRKLVPDWVFFVFFFHFLLLPSFCSVPVPDSLGCFIPTSAQLSYSLASSARVMKRYTRLLSGCIFQLIVCSWIVLLRELFPRRTICPFAAGFKNTFGC